jgi:transposase-like protein
LGKINELFAMRKRIDEPELLVEFITEKTSYSADFKALVLRLVEQHQDITQVAQLSCVPERTIYGWLADWNQAKKKP